MDFSQEAWARIVKEESEMIDYANFKNAVHDNTPRDQAYLNVWSVVRSTHDT